MDERIKNSIEFIKFNLGRTEFADSVFISFLCGYFHTYPKKARDIADIMLEKGLMRRERKQSILYWMIIETKTKTAAV